MKGLNSLCYYLGQIIEKGSWRLCFLLSRITGINLEREIYLLLRSGNALPMGMPWILLTGDGGIKIVIQQLILGPNNGPASVMFWELSLASFFFLTLSLIPFSCSVVVYTSPVYDPGLWAKTHFRLYLRSLSLIPFACSVVVYTSPVYDPGLRVKTHFCLYLHYSPLWPAICSNMMTLKITLRLWLSDK